MTSDTVMAALGWIRCTETFHIGQEKNIYMHDLKGCIHLKTPYGAATEKVIELGLICVSLGIKHLRSCLPTAEEKNNLSRRHIWVWKIFFLAQTDRLAPCSAAHPNDIIPPYSWRLHVLCWFMTPPWQRDKQLTAWLSSLMLPFCLDLTYVHIFS